MLFLVFVSNIKIFWFYNLYILLPRQYKSITFDMYFHAKINLNKSPKVVFHFF